MKTVDVIYSEPTYVVELTLSELEYLKHRCNAPSRAFNDIYKSFEQDYQAYKKAIDNIKEENGKGDRFFDVANHMWSSIDTILKEEY